MQSSERRPKRSNRHSPLPVFCITLVLVLSCGALCLFILWKRSEKSSEKDTASAPVSLWEDIGTQTVSASTVDTEETEEQTLLPGETALSSDDDSITFAFAGDILFDSSYDTGYTLSVRGVDGCFDDGVQQIMEEADVFMLNNEFPYTQRGTPIEDKQFTFRADPSTASYLQEMGVDLVSLANNHIFDYGEEGLLDTLDTLQSIGQPYVGAGRNLQEASAPAYYSCGDMTIAVLNATEIEGYDNPPTRGATDTQSGVFRCYDPTNLYEAVQEAGENADFVIVYIHWGTEKAEQPDYRQLEHAKGLAAAGCDLIVGDHPHVLQGIQNIDGCMVMYSLGNFLFTSYDTDTGILEATFSPKQKKLTSLQFIPMLQSGTAVHLLDGTEKTRVLTDLQSLSGVSIDSDGYIALP